MSDLEIGKIHEKPQNMNLVTLDFPPPSAPTGPTLLALGGLGQSAEQFVEISGLREVAAELGRRVVFAQGQECIWNFWRPKDNPCMNALESLVQSLSPPVDLIGFSAGAVMIYSYGCEWGRAGQGIRRVVSYAGENGWRGAGVFPAVPVLMIRNSCDELIGADVTSQLDKTYYRAGCTVEMIEPDPPPPWPDYPGARLGHFWHLGCNPQIAEFLGAP